MTASTRGMARALETASLPAWAVTTFQSLSLRAAWRRFRLSLSGSTSRTLFLASRFSASVRVGMTLPAPVNGRVGRMADNANAAANRARWSGYVRARTRGEPAFDSA